MSDNQKRILDMLAEGKISADEAQKLLAAIGPGGDAAKSPPSAGDAKYLHLVVVPNPEAPKGEDVKGVNPEAEDAEDAEGEDVKRVNIRVPLALIRAGIKFTSLIPADASEQVNEALKEKGIDFDVRNLKPEDLEELIMALHDLEVDVQDGQEKVHVYVE
jgi:Fe-S-cluster formation regulator IscX/YfhJ